MKPNLPTAFACLALASIPSAQTTAEPARFSASVNGPAGAAVKLEASADLGATDDWPVIGQATFNGSGVGTFTEVEEPGSVGEPSNFDRLRLD